MCGWTSCLMTNAASTRDPEAPLDAGPQAPVRYRQGSLHEGVYSTPPQSTTPLRLPARAGTVSRPLAATTSCAPHSNPSGSRAEREKGGRGRESSLLPVWLPQGKAAPDGLDQRRGHRERIAEGKASLTSAPLLVKPPCRGGTGARCPRLTTLVNPTERERRCDE